MLNPTSKTLHTLTTVRIKPPSSNFIPTLTSRSLSQKPSYSTSTLSPSAKSPSNTTTTKAPKNPPVQHEDTQPPSSPTTTNPSTHPQKSTTELDADLRAKLEAISGGGGEAGLELENGKPVAMGRAVRENMFRVI